MSINEEQIALESLKEVASDDFDTLGDDISPKMAQNILNVIDKQRKVIKEYKRYFKLAISDLQSEGYMQMPYKNIEKYYSKREDIV